MPAVCLLVISRFVNQIKRVLAFFQFCQPSFASSVCLSVRDRQTDRQTETHRERDTERDRDRERVTDRQRDRQTDRQTDRENV